MKGQWFIIATVIVVGVFLVLSTLFKSYYSVDSTQVGTSEEFYFKNIKNGINKTFDIYCPNEANMEKNMDEYISFINNSMNKLGMFIFIEYDKGVVSCPDKNTLGSFKILLATDRAVYYTDTLSDTDVESIMGKDFR